MKKYILIVFTVLLLSNCAKTQSKPIMGYDFVLWGSSFATVRYVYNIGQEIQLAHSINEPDTYKLIQENISENIKNRTFIFFGGKLHQVYVLYNDSSDDNLQNIKTELKNKFGDITDYNESLLHLIDNSKLLVKTFVFGQYSPELTIQLVHSIDRQTNVVDGLAVVYYWEKGINEYMASR
jgi:hypothetical protein